MLQAAHRAEAKQFGMAAQTVQSEEWRASFILARSEEAADEGDRLLRAVRAGIVTRVRNGVYMTAANWQALDVDARYRALGAAFAVESHTAPVFSHHSAAALWRLPIVGPWPTDVHVAVNRASGGRSDPGLVRHCEGQPRAQLIDGLLATTLARTAVDMARSAPLRVSVPMVDAALRERDGTIIVDKSDLIEELAGIRSRRGMARCRDVIAFADGESGSAGESLSRVNIRVAGLPAPRLQESFYDDAGLIGIVDFFWPEQHLIGEFDGRGKYLRDEFTRGRDAGDIVIQEKIREDRMRALGHRFARWGWSTARSPAALTSILRAAGLA